MEITYYKIIENGYSSTGVIYAPKEWPYPIAEDAQPVKNWQSLVLELKDGPYCHFHKVVGWANVVSKEFKDLLLSFVGENDYLEFFPVKIVSKQYGDKEYYIMHFTKIFDVIDKENTVYGPGDNNIIKPRLLFEKVKNLKIFNSQPMINDVIISNDVRKAIIKNKLDAGIEFWPIFCFQ